MQVAGEFGLRERVGALVIAMDLVKDLVDAARRVARVVQEASKVFLR